MPPPDRWEKYKALGAPIPETRFISFKVPLKEELCRNLPEDESFTPEQLIQKIEESGKRLGLIVDLTFTRKYYNGQYFVKRDIQYEKIFTQGHEIPNDDVVQRFYEVVDVFVKNNTEEDAVIGVHCTHGVNRTGYLVCRYMIERLKMDPDKAIASFGEARGHPIERENYIVDLKRRSSDRFAPPHENSEVAGEHPASSRDNFSWNTSQVPQNDYAGRGNHGGHPYNRYFSQRGRQEGSFSGSNIGESRRGLHYGVYSSPLEHFNTPTQNGWGNPARSGWGPSAAPRQDYRARDFSADGGRYGREPRRHFHNHQKYSYRRSNSMHSQDGKEESQSYRIRREYGRDGNTRSSFFGSGQADRDRNWRQKNKNESQSGRGRDVGGYQGRANSDAQDWRSEGFGDGGQGDRQVRKASGGWSSDGWNQGRGGWNDRSAGGHPLAESWNA